MTDGTVWLTQDRGQSFRAALSMGSIVKEPRQAGVTSLRVLARG